MRILQLIDSLEAGGAERMAVNYANALSNKIEFSSLVATRYEGQLRNQLADEVGYLCLFKKKTLDFRAIFKLRQFVKLHRINIIQAHSSSFFMAVIIKITLPKIKIIWHNHFGIGDSSNYYPSSILFCFSIFFSGIIAVNESLVAWSKNKLYFKNSFYLPNFVSNSISQNRETILKGEQGKRIVCLANLRKEKNHLFLIQIAKQIHSTYPDWTFHLVGKDFEDYYSQSLKKEIINLKLEQTVFMYNSCQDIHAILQQATIGVLSSLSEGFPLTLLEYGLHKIPVVVTNVGQMQTIIENYKNGFLAHTNDVLSFSDYLLALIKDDCLQKKIGEQLFFKVKKEFSQKIIITKYLNWIDTTIENE